MAGGVIAALLSGKDADYPNKVAACRSIGK